MHTFVANKTQKSMDKQKTRNEEAVEFGAKVECIIRVTLSDGTVIERKSEAPGGVPDRGEMDLGSIEGVMRSFGDFEQASIETCGKTLNDVADEYMKEMSKKKRRGKER